MRFRCCWEDEQGKCPKPEELYVAADRLDGQRTHFGRFCRTHAELLVSWFLEGKHHPLACDPSTARTEPLEGL